MRTLKLLILAPAFLVAAACSRHDDRAAADSALNRDLNLANQVGPYQDSISPAEGFAAGAIAPAPAARRRTTSGTTASRTTSTRTARRSTSGSSGRVGSSSGGTVTTSSGGEVTVKHTKRDAAIGAAAGAVIGATTSKDKVKGAIVGGVVGGILGGVIGNNVDKTKKKP